MHQMKGVPLLVIASALVVACGEAERTPSASQATVVPTTEQMVASAKAAGMVQVTFPNPDPGIPAYARLGLTLQQVFHNAEWVVVPFYRDPNAIAGDFNLLSIFDFPGPGGPGAFGVPLTISGHYMVEADAPLGTFPKISVSKGDAVPVWFVRWAEFEAGMEDHVVTMDDLRAMERLEGIATTFNETLRPRVGEHLVVLNAKGKLADGRSFDVHLTHVEDTTRSLQIRIR